MISPDADAALELISDEPSAITLNGKPHTAYLSRPITQFPGDGSREVRRQIVVSGSMPEGAETVGAEGEIWAIESAEDLGGAVVLETIRE